MEKLTKKRIESLIFKSKVNMCSYGLLTLGSGWFYTETNDMIFFWAAIICFLVGLFSVWTTNHFTKKLNKINGE